MVFFDSRWDGATGIGRFCRELGSRLHVVSWPGLSGNPAGVLDPMRLSLLMGFNHSSVLFSPGFNAPLIGLDRFVLTIHDLNHIDVEESSTFFKRIYYATVLRRACRKAARVFTVSEFSRRRIIEWSGVTPDRVVCVGNGVSDIFRSSPKNDVKRDVSSGFILCVSNRKSHKNEKTLVRALAAIATLPNLRLIFTGPPKQGLISLASELGVDERISFAGKVTESELVDLYAKAALLALPSLYEGFGLPAIEAMAVGCPVVCSNTTALGELAAEICTTFDPSNQEDITEAIESVLFSVTRRQEMQRAGLVGSVKYNWDSVAKIAQESLDSAFKSNV